MGSTQSMPNQGRCRYDLPIPDDTVRMIVSYLDPHTQCQLRLVSKLTRAIIDDSMSLPHSQLYIQTYNPTTTEFANKHTAASISIETPDYLAVSNIHKNVKNLRLTPYLPTTTATVLAHMSHLPITKLEVRNHFSYYNVCYYQPRGGPDWFCNDYTHTLPNTLRVACLHIPIRVGFTNIDLSHLNALRELELVIIGVPHPTAVFTPTLVVPSAVRSLKVTEEIYTDMREYNNLEDSTLTLSLDTCTALHDVHVSWFGEIDMGTIRGNGGTLRMECVQANASITGFDTVRVDLPPKYGFDTQSRLEEAKENVFRHYRITGRIAKTRHHDSYTIAISRARVIDIRNYNCVWRLPDTTGLVAARVPWAVDMNTEVWAARRVALYLLGYDMGDTDALCMCTITLAIPSYSPIEVLILEGMKRVGIDCQHHSQFPFKPVVASNGHYDLDMACNRRLDATWHHPPHPGSPHPGSFSDTFIVSPMPVESLFLRGVESITASRFIESNIQTSHTNCKFLGPFM